MKMLIIQQSKLIRRTLLLTLLLEFTFVDMNTSNEAMCKRGTMRKISYVREDTVMNVEWSEAREHCSKFNSTLPVICNQNEQVDFTRYLREQNMLSSFVWTSGRRRALSGWKWVDGQPYRATIRNPHESYTHVNLDADGSYKAEPPFRKAYYLCQNSKGDPSCSSPNATNVTSGCIVPGDTDRTWYDARNQCLIKSGDLAVLSDADLVNLKRSNLYRASSYWIGLRKDAWYWTWQNSEPSIDADEVKYSNWSSNQPSSYYDCISIDSSNGEWTAVRCTDNKKVVCQTSLAETTLSTTVKFMPASSSKSSSPISSGPMISSTTLSSATGSTPDISGKATEKSDSTVLLYPGLGAGIAIIIICIIVILAVRFKRKPRREMYQSNVQSNHSEQNRKYEHVAPQHPSYSPAGAYASSTPPDADDTKGVYAEISLAGLTQSDNEPQNQPQSGIVYASLDFQKEPIYQEPDKKKPTSADPTKVGPMGDIYAMPDTKGRAATSPGNESTTSHPILVTSQGDVYALPIKDAKSPTAKQPPQEIYANTKT